MTPKPSSSADTHDAMFSVALAPCADYDAGRMTAVLGTLLDSLPLPALHGRRVLVKPNLLRAQPLSCTHPQVVYAVCAGLLDRGAQVRVADSPGFGTARGVARRIGLQDLLRPLGLSVEALRRPVAIQLRDGGHWGVSRLALESDLLCSLPRIKVHSQMRLTLAVKNLFGCVCGLRKALAHTAQGDSAALFARALTDLLTALPPTMAVADGVTAMHIAGPSGGQPFPLRCLGAATSAAALDTALYQMLGVGPEDIPLWAALQDRGLPDALPERLRYPLATPRDFDVRHFQIPRELLDVSFRPRRLLLSLCRRLWTALRP